MTQPTKAAELPDALLLADALRKMDEAKKYHPSGPSPAWLPHKIIHASLQWLDSVPVGTKLYATPPAQAADSVLEDTAASEVLMEHSGCGSGTQVGMLTVRLNPGDKVIMLKGRITQATDAARTQGANHD